MKKSFKKINKVISKFYWLNKMKFFILHIYMRYSSVELHNCARGGLKRRVLGRNNSIYIGKDTVLENTEIYINGNNNSVIIGKKCQFSCKCSLWLVGDNISVLIGDNTTFNYKVHFMAAEKGSTIQVGNDCMFSLDITLRTSDSHPIYDMVTKKRINPSKSIFIGNHVWISSHVNILKGVKIGDGAVIGTNSVVTKDVPENSLSVGIPNKIVKNSVYWERQIKQD